VDQLWSHAGLIGEEESVSEEVNHEDFPEPTTDSIEEGGVEIREQLMWTHLPRTNHRRQEGPVPIYVPDVGTPEHTTIANQGTEGKLAPKMPIPGLYLVLRSYPQRNRTQPNWFEPSFKIRGKECRVCTVIL